MYNRYISMAVEATGAFRLWGEYELRSTGSQHPIIVRASWRRYLARWMMNPAAFSPSIDPGCFWHDPQTPSPAVFCATDARLDSFSPRTGPGTHWVM